jgi:hypothetical protein
MYFWLNFILCQHFGFQQCHFGEVTHVQLLLRESTGGNNLAAPITYCEVKIPLANPGPSTFDNYNCPAGKVLTTTGKVVNDSETLPLLRQDT